MHLKGLGYPPSHCSVHIAWRRRGEEEGRGNHIPRPSQLLVPFSQRGCIGKNKLIAGLLHYPTKETQEMPPDSNFSWRYHNRRKIKCFSLWWDHTLRPILVIYVCQALGLCHLKLKKRGREEGIWNTFSNKLKNKT